jgi:hypothetical protein
MERNPFYAEFLPHMGLRYFAAAIFEHTPDKLAAVHVQRTRKQGHVDKREISTHAPPVPALSSGE